MFMVFFFYKSLFKLIYIILGNTFFFNSTKIHFKQKFLKQGAPLHFLLQLRH